MSLDCPECSEPIEEINQVMQGMNSIFDLLSIFTNNYNEGMGELTRQKEQVAQDILNVFNHINYKDDKDNYQEDIYYYFTNFLESIEGNENGAISCLEIPEKDTDEVKTHDKKLTIKDVALFLTGSKFITPTLKGKGTINFLPVSEKSFGKRVIVNACSYDLSIPISERYYSSSDSFIKSSSEDIISSPGYGKP